MLRCVKYWRSWCGLWKANLPACFARSCCSTRTASTRGTAPPPAFPSPTPRLSTAFALDPRRDHAALPCTAENPLLSPTFSKIRSGRRTEAWPSPMGSAPAGPLPYWRIRATRWARLRCIIANRAVRARPRPASWRWPPTSLALPLNASWGAKSANDCDRPRRSSRT